jgi:hypothetical protein
MPKSALSATTSVFGGGEHTHNDNRVTIDFLLFAHLQQYLPSDLLKKIPNPVLTVILF